MTGLKKIFIMALVFCIAHFPLLAAEVQLESEIEETSDVQQSGADNVETDNSASGDDTEDVSEEESPSRFIPTEQISQDLGVSFPADI